MPSYSPLFLDATYGVPLNTTGTLTQPKVKEAVANVAVGAAAGATATANRTQVKHSTNAQSKDGGKMEVESIADINRATTATDVANLKKQLSRQNVSSFAMPRDLSGNGGPAFTRGF